MRKIGFTSYKSDIKELLAGTFKVETVEEKRKMFICMLNEFLPQQSQIICRKKSFYEKNLRDIFTDKIFSFLPLYKLAPAKVNKVSRIFVFETKLFNQFLKQLNTPKAKFLSKKWEFEQDFRFSSYNHPAASLIELIFNGKELEMMINLDELFTQTIYKRLKPSASAVISLDMPYIHISENGKRTRLIPSWKKLNPKELHKHSKKINEGFSDLSNKHVDKCFLIYPKNNKFKKHVVIKGKESLQLKVIPYSFSYTQKNIA